MLRVQPYSKVNSPHEAVSLQADLEAMVRWSDTWQLPFNETKCKVLHLGQSNPHLQYMIRDTELRTVQVERDLGVHIDCDLKFRRHAAALVAKATQVLAVICRSFVRIDQQTLPALYKSLVRPNLEFGNLVWGPFRRADENW